MPLAEFTYNNTIHASTKYTPFFANYGRHPKFDTFHIQNSTSNPAAKDFATRLFEIHQEIKLHLHEAQQIYKTNADEQRKEPPPFKIGDQVWLIRRHIQSQRPSNKLDYKKIGPFTIIKKINPVAFKLRLPHSMKIHHVFHVSLLEPYYQSMILDRTQVPPPPIQINGQEEYEVEEILDSKIKHGILYFLVHWRGYDINERTWEPMMNLTNAQDALYDFRRKYPTKAFAAPRRTRRSGRG